MTLKQGLLGVDTFDRRVAEMEGKQNPPGMSRVIVEAPKNGVWSGNNNLGIEQPFAPSANNRQTILKMPEWGFPEVWTVSLGMKGFPQGQFDGFFVRAIIEVGVGGVTQTYEIDWRNGTHISVPMNAINVIAEFENLDILTEGQGLSLSVELSRGNRPGGCSCNTNTLVVTEPGGSLAVGTLMESVVLNSPASSGFMRLPPFATRVYAAPASSSPASILGFWNNNVVLALISGNGAGAAVVKAVRGSDLLIGNGVEVSGSARFVEVSNASGAPIVFTAWADIAG